MLLLKRMIPSRKMLWMPFEIELQHRCSNLKEKISTSMVYSVAFIVGRFLRWITGMMRTAGVGGLLAYQKWTGDMANCDVPTAISFAAAFGQRSRCASVTKKILVHPDHRETSRQLFSQADHVERQKIGPENVVLFQRQTQDLSQKEKKDSNYFSDKHVPSSYFVASKRRRKHVLEHPGI